MELTAAEYVSEQTAEPQETRSAEPVSESSDYDYGNDDDGLDDVDDIVDPLAGLRNEHTERFERQGFNPGYAGERDPLELGEGEQGGREAGDEGLDFGSSDYGSSDYGNPLQPKRRQPIVPGGGGGGEAGGGVPPGNTLFERMANLSRGSGGPARGEEDEDDDDDPGSSTLNIPRFLGRQNNQ